MRLAHIVVVLAVLRAVAAPAAYALGFNDYFKPPNGSQGTPYDFQFQARAGCDPVYYYSMYRGSLPPDLTLGQNGRISGTPSSPGVYQFTVQLESYYKGCTSYPSQRDFTIVIGPKFGIVGVPYSVRFGASGEGSKTWSISSGQLPPGLSLTPDGTLSGSPTTVGLYTWVLKLNGVATQQVDMEVVKKLTPSFSGSRSGELGVALAVRLVTSGGKGSYTWAQTGGALPAGVAFTGQTISGTPRATGSFSARFTVTDALRETAVANVSLTIAAKVAVDTLHLAPARAGRPYQATLRTVGGVAPFTWKVTSGRFPIGIRLDRKTGTLTGAARKPGTFPLTFSVTDSLGRTSERRLALIVAGAQRPKPS